MTMGLSTEPLDDRTRFARWGSIATLSTRGVTVATSLVLLSVLARRLAPEEFGLFAVLTSIVMLSGSMDFGLANGLRNRLASLVADSSESDTARRYCYAAIYVLAALAVVVVAAIAASASVIPWAWLFNIESHEFAQAARWGLPVVFGLMSMNVPLLVGGAGLYAYQESHRKALYDGATAVAAALLAAGMALTGAGFNAICMIYFGAYTAGGLLGLIVFLVGRRWRPLVLSGSEIADCVRQLLASSVSFWLLSLSAAVLVAAGPFMAGRTIGLEAAGHFGLVQRLFMFLITVQQAILLPFWSAFTHAAASSDWQWVRNTLRWLVVKTVGGVAVAAVTLVMSAELILRIWAGRSLQVSTLAGLMAVWAIVYAWTSVYSVCLNGLGRLKGQVVCSCLGAVLVPVMCEYLGPRFGTTGIAIPLIVGLLPLAILAPLEYLEVLRAQSETDSVEPAARPSPI